MQTGATNCRGLFHHAQHDANKSIDCFWIWSATWRMAGKPDMLAARGDKVPESAKQCLVPLSSNQVRLAANATHHFLGAIPFMV